MNWASPPQAGVDRPWPEFVPATFAVRNYLRPGTRFQPTLPLSGVVLHNAQKASQRFCFLSMPWEAGRGIDQVTRHTKSTFHKWRIIINAEKSILMRLYDSEWSYLISCPRISVTRIAYWGYTVLPAHILQCQPWNYTAYLPFGHVLFDHVLNTNISLLCSRP